MRPSIEWLTIPFHHPLLPRLPRELLTSVTDAAYLTAPCDLNISAYDEWIMDVFCGTESMLEECRGRGWSYVGWDMDGESRLVEDDGRVECRFITDLSSGWDLARMFHFVYVQAGLLPEYCRLVWHSPPCEFYSYLNRPSQRHRFWNRPNMPPLPGLPTVVNNMIEGIICDHSVV